MNLLSCRTRFVVDPTHVSILTKHFPKKHNVFTGITRRLRLLFLIIFFGFMWKTSSSFLFTKGHFFFT